MFFDMLKLGRLAESRYIPIQSSKPFVKCRISTADVANVALEVLNVDGVEANDSGVESDVGFGDVSAVIERRCVGSKMGFGTVESSEEGMDGFFVGFLRAEDVSTAGSETNGKEWEVRTLRSRSHRRHC